MIICSVSSSSPLISQSTLRLKHKQAQNIPGAKEGLVPTAQRQSAPSTSAPQKRVPRTKYDLLDIDIKLWQNVLTYIDRPAEEVFGLMPYVLDLIRNFEIPRQIPNRYSPKFMAQTEKYDGKSAVDIIHEEAAVIGATSDYIMLQLSKSDLFSGRLARCLFDGVGQVAKSDMGAMMALFQSMYASGGEWLL